MLFVSREPFSASEDTCASFFFFFLRNLLATLHSIMGILVPRPETEPMSPVVETWSLNHWAAREVPAPAFLITLPLHLQSRNTILNPSHISTLSDFPFFYMSSASSWRKVSAFKDLRD